MASNRKMGAVELLFDGASGIYIPQRFAEECTGPQWHNVSEDDRAILAAGPEHDFYWDAWDTVLDGAEFHTEDGAIYRLHQDGDVFVYCFERMTPEEQINLFGEYNPPDGTEVFYILDCFASMIEYGETDDLSDDEIEACEKFLADYPAPRYIVSVDPILSEDFGRCEITSVRGRLVGVLVVDREHNVLASADEFRAELAEGDTVHIVDGEKTIRLSTGRDVWDAFIADAIARRAS